MSTILRDCKYCTILTEKKEGMLSDVCTNNKDILWKHAVVLFVFSKNVPDGLKILVKKAMENIKNVSIVRFIEITRQAAKAYNGDYVKIINGNIFQSYVGRTGSGEQPLYVSDDQGSWPFPIGSSMHELMHVLGIYHEHSHPDAGKYLEIKTSDKNYRRKEPDDVLDGRYDPYSIMHYPLSRYMALKEGITDINIELIGQRLHLSEGDKDGLKKLYSHVLIEDQEIYLRDLHTRLGSVSPF